MAEDYLTERGLASYVETHWMDYAHIDKMGVYPKSLPMALRGCKYATQSAAVISEQVKKNNLHPVSLLEVGPGLGRVAFELINTLTSLNDVVMVEPSFILHSHLKQIFSGESVSLPVIGDVKDLSVASMSLAQHPSHGRLASVNMETINAAFDAAVTKKKFDLVVCLNVLDQCAKPVQLVNDLKDKVKINGLLCVSSSYQYPSKHLAAGEAEVSSLTEHFDSGWQRLHESDLEYKIRQNHRYSLTFESHFVIYKRIHA